MRLQATRTSVTSTGGAGDALYRDAGSRPVLDQRFAKDKSLVDKVSGLNLINFTRSSSGTFVNSAGIIERIGYNLFTYSQELDNAAWTTDAINATSVLATGINAPDGTESAYAVTSSAANGLIRQSGIPITSNSTYTWSVFIKKKNSAQVTMNPVLVGGTAYLAAINYNFDTDTITKNSDDYGNSPFGREIISDGWVRIYTTVTDQGSNTQGRMYLKPSETGAGDMYAWGAQFEKGDLGNYAVTTTASNSAPRFDHDPETLESLGLLIEDAGTNLLQNSSGEESLSYWGKTSFSTGSIVDGPAGANTAYQYLSTGGSVASRVFSQGSNILTSVIGVQYVLSVYVKPVNYNIVTFGSGNPPFTTGNSKCSFDLSTGTTTVVNTAAESARAIPAGNGWYRLEVVTIPTTAAGNLQLLLDLGSGGSETHTTSEGFQVYGFQVEVATDFKAVTSYIPTTNAQATRLEDNVTILGAEMSPFYNQNEGTVVVTNSSYNSSQATRLRAIFQIYSTDTAASVFRHYILYANGNPFNVASRYNGGNVFVPINAGNPTYNNDTTAYGYSSSEISKVFHDGSFLTSTSSVIDWSTYNANRFVFGGFSRLGGHLSRLTYFPTKLTDQEMINVTGGDTAIPVITYGITSPGGTFNLRSTGTVDYAVDWDSTGSYEESTLNTLPHTYTAGSYDLVIHSDEVYAPYFNDVAADVTQITSVVIGSGANLGTDLSRAFFGATNMTTFTCPFSATSSVTNFFRAWRICSSLTSFPVLDTSSGTAFSSCWFGCNSLTSFPLLDMSSGTRFTSAWRSCTSLASFPANMFDTTGTLDADAFNNTWLNCALTAQSIENILVSLDTNGATGITLGINTGNNAGKTTWSTAANTAYDNLIAKGWTISFNA